MDKNLDIILQLATNTEANWTAKDPVIPDKVAVYSSDKFWQFKIGDGKSKWSQLAYNRASTPYPLILQLNGSVASTHYGTSSSTVNITPAAIGAAPKTHTHTKSQISDMPTSLKNPYAFTIALNGAAQTPYDGSVARTVNITPTSIGAAPASGSTSISKLAGTITMGSGDAATILQNGGTYHQKINILDNATSGDGVFQFQQSTDTGKTFATLMEIRDDGNVIATKFTGNLAGNSYTTNKFITPRKIGNVLFDGSKDITLSEIGAATSAQGIKADNALPSTGGTLTGSVNMNGNIGFNFRYPTQPTGGHACGLSYSNYGDARFGGIGAYGDKGTYSAFYIGFGDSAWSPANSLFITNSNITYKSNKMWHAGNDGAGSGLDADLLDGKQASAFALASHTHTIANITNLQATLDGKATSAQGSKADNALLRTGGTMTNNITFSNTLTGIFWSMNTDSAKIYFKNDSDGDTDSYLGFETADNGNEYFKWMQTSGSTKVELMSLKSDALRVKGGGIFNGSVTASSFSGNASSASKWATARNLALTGAVSGSVNIDGSSNVSLSTVPGKMNYSGTNNYIAYPDGGRYTTTTSSITGYLKVTLPQSWTNTMMSFTVTIYNYSTNASAKYYISGYNYSDSTPPSWNQVTAYSLGNNSNLPKNNYTIRFGHDGSKCAIYIGESNTVWVYPQVTISDVTLGYKNTEFDKWKSGWSIGFTTTLGAITGTVTNPSVMYRSKTADQFTFTRTINGTNFNGTASITTAKWGTARNITIGNSTKSIDGSGNVTYTLSEIGAAPSNHTHNYAGSSTAGGVANSASKIATARNIGNAPFDGTANISLTQIGAAPTTHNHTKSQITDFPTSMPANGGTSSYTDFVNGVYTGNGGKQPPSYIPSGKVRFNMTNETGYYCDWIFMDTYTGPDVAYVSAIGLEKKADPCLWIMSGAKGGSTWSVQRRVPSFSTGISSGQFISADGTTGKIKTSGYTASSFAPASHTHTKAQITDMPASLKNPNALTISLNGTSQGAYDGSVAKSINITVSSIGAAAASHTHPYLSLSGGTMTGVITSSLASTTHIAGNRGTAIINSTAGAGVYTMLDKLNSTNGYFTDGVWSDKRMFFYTVKSTVDAASNSYTKSVTILDEAGNSSFPGTVTAPTFKGALTGNASTATSAGKWTTARSLGIGSSSKSWDGSANLSYSLAEIGAAPINHASTAATYGLATASAYGHVKVTIGNGLALASGAISMGAASASAPGAITTGTQTIAGQKTFSGTVVLSKTTDLSGTANNSPALIVGGVATGAHIEIDSNEIQAKTNGTTVGQLNLNTDGGQVVVGGGGLQVNSGIKASGDITSTKNIIIGNCTLSYDSTNKCLNFIF